jgi:hypothetical protein
MPKAFLAAHWRKLSMRKGFSRSIGILIIVAAAAVLVAPPRRLDAQTPATTYQPKYKGDPARSDSEFQAIAYMNVVIRAQRHFQKQYGHYATSLAELVHTGTFTKRMVNPDRGDYTVHFKGKDDSFILIMTPQHQDGEHRSFYAEDNGKIRAEEDKTANADSPVVK